MWGEVARVLGSSERQGSRDGLVLSVTTLPTADFSAMTLMFRGCYGWTGPGKEPGPGLVTLVPWWTARISARGSRAPERARTPTGQYRGRDLGLPPQRTRLRGRLRHPLRRACSSTGRIASFIARGLFGVPLPFSQPPARAARASWCSPCSASCTCCSSARSASRSATGSWACRCARWSAGRVLPLQAMARTVLLCLFLPAVVWDRDGRGLHDKVPNTVIVRTR